MKMNKLVKSSVATSMALLLLSGTANAEGKITPVSVKKVDDKVTLYKTTATADSDKFKISQILTFNFIKDKSYDKDTLVLKATGNINSGFVKPNPNDYDFSKLYWGAKYNVSISSQSNDSVNVVDYAPKNQNEEFQVQNTLGYTFGGDISISNGLSGGLNGNTAFSETINYKQESYRTTLSRNTNYKNVGWGVEAHKIMNNGWGPYGRDSFHPTYGNELFLAGRQSSAYAGQNFIAQHQMPLLSRSNFNPEFLSVLSHRQDGAKKSKITVTYQREMDWENHKVKLLDTKETENNK
ncbi:MAG: beta-channel forming cytolysin [Staphylococcus aureus]|nr:beta-channel forming cytolysin [Staphylococcus aureus]